MNIRLDSEAQTLTFGKKLFAAIAAGCVVFLSGQLGAGKTTLVRGFLRAAGYKGTVKSPTFTLVEEYTVQCFPVVHFDLYRIADAEELEWMGIRDYLNGEAVCFIEWPQRGTGILPEADLALQLDIIDNHRMLTLMAHSVVGKAIESDLRTGYFPGGQ